MTIHSLSGEFRQTDKTAMMVPTSESGTEFGNIQLADLVVTILDSWRLILGTLFLFLLSGGFYIFLVPPVYRADVLLQLEDKVKGVGALTDLSTFFQDVAPVTAEFEILKSRMVLGSAVDNLKLDIVAQPSYFPIFGGLFAGSTTTAKATVENSEDAANNHAWSGESIHVARFDVPAEFEGKTFTVVAKGDDHFELYGPEDRFITAGVMGNPITASLGNAKLSLFISELRCKPGTRFELRKLARLEAIDGLKESLQVTELGKQSGILRLSLEGEDSILVTNILNEIANIYLRQSVERKSAEAQKTLSFLEKQLPVLKEKMENAEAALNKYRLKKGSVDLPKETQVTLEKMVAIDAQLTQLRRERADLIRRFTPQHPRIAALDAQIETLNDENTKVDTKVQGLPGTQQEILRLTRDMEVNSALYTTLMNSAQELKVVKAGAVANVRIVDYAVKPIKPVKPNKGLTVALNTVLGIVCGLGVAFLRKSMQGVVEDPSVIEKKLGLPIYATIPLSKKQQEIDKRGSNASPPATILATVESTDMAIESLRSLRTSLYFAQLNAKNNVISITSPGPGAGKSFISVNLSTVLASAGKKVLLIDADMRKGRIYEIFGTTRDGGLSEIIAGSRDLGVEIDAIAKFSLIDNLDILTAGTIPPNPSELLLHDRFAALLDAAAMVYDHVIVDSPPVLAVTDAAIIGRLAGATLLVIKDGHSPLREIEQSIKRLRQANVNLRGAVYNGVKIASSRYGYGKYYGHGYRYMHVK